VPLPSGGYIVINQTEALVSIDVNSGRSTREHNIEDTAHQTNLEASDEVARQLRLRDLAGLIVIDYIDMEERRNNRSVERRIKEALKDDRARIQVGRISHFGLLEMSRQRIRTGVLESTTEVCPHCMGTGHVRSPASVSLHVLRSIEDHLLKSASHNIIIRTRTNVALYILNQKRSHLSALEAQFGLTITIMADETVNTAAHFVLERGEPVTVRPVLSTSIQPTSVQPGEETFEAEPEIVEVEDEAEADEEAEESEDGGEERPQQAGRASEDGERRRKRRRRRRRGGGEGREQTAGEAGPRTDEAGDESHRDAALVAESIADDTGPAGEDDGEGGTEGDAGDNGSALGPDGQPRRRRRGRRGGRRARRTDGDTVTSADAPSGEATAPAAEADSSGHADAVSQSYAIAAELGAESPAEVAPHIADEPPPAHHEAPRAAEPVQQTARPDEIRPAEPAVDNTPAPEPEPPQPKRGGWWQRRSFF
jgi:ribonuclease E